MTPRERFAFLADKLEEHSGKLLPVFSMRCWAYRLTPRSTIKTLIRGCGTAACAAGVAALLPELKAQGLMLEQDPMKRGHSYIRFNDEIHICALMTFFGITYDQAHDVFLPEAYSQVDIKPADVVAKIRKILRRQP